MNFPDAIKAFFTNYFNFNSRSRRSEFWWAYLFLFLVNIVASISDQYLAPDMVKAYDNGPISILWGLAIFIPFLALAIRRLHDIGKSGWNILFILIPIAGIIILIVWWCKESTGPNEYGNPANGILPAQPFNNYYNQPYNPYTQPQQPFNGVAQPNPYQAPQQPFAAPQQQPGPYGTNPLTPSPQQFGQQNPYGPPPKDSNSFGNQPNPYINENDPNRNPYQS
jgi:uncharacterized membrane protein YhaH (DUF805 family)